MKKGKLPAHKHSAWNQTDYDHMAEYASDRAINRPVYYLEYLKKGFPNPKPKEDMKYGTDGRTNSKH